MNLIARTKLSELPITWKEAYTDKTKRLKDMYEEIVGSGSYFRFEGNNRENGDEYYVVVGPAKVKSPRPEFFAGVRKLPSDFAAGGKYFSEMREAIEYASETWGIEIPSGISYYDADDLKNIGSKAKEWRDANKWTEDRESGDEDYKEDDEEDKSSVVPSVTVADILRDEFYYRYSMGAPARVGRQGYKWYDIDQAVLGNDPEFNQDIQQWPNLEKAANQAYSQRERFRKMIANTYGVDHLKSEFYHIWLSFSPDFGAYIVSVGPYFELVDRAAGTYAPTDRFDAFWKRLNVFSKDFLDKKTAELIDGYATKYGIDLTPEDYQAPSEGGLAPEFKLTPSGRAKVYDAVGKYYGIDTSIKGKGLKEQLIAKYQEKYPQWKAQLDAAYAKSQANGDAFLKSQPPPPDIKWMKPRPIGQQLNTKGHRVDSDSGGETKGFDSLKEAIDFVNTKSWAGCPMLEGYSNVTGSQLAAARIAHENHGEVVPEGMPTPKKTKVKKTVGPVPVPSADDDDIPISDEDLDKAHESASAKDDNSTVADTISKLVVLADKLEGMGKKAESGEIHRLLLKHASGITWEDGNK